MRSAASSAIEFAPAIVTAVLLGPLLAGVFWTLAPAFGHLPALGAREIGLEPFARVLSAPESARAAALTLSSALISTAISLALALAFAARGGPARSGLRSVLLAAPHAAVAIGLAFLIAPSGWIARALSPEITGWTRPPDIAIVGDGWGVALIFGLVVKETPFLTAIALAARASGVSREREIAARALGHSPAVAHLCVVAPALYARMRLSVFAVLVFAVGVVDMALVLGPSHPPTFAALIARWFADADPTMRLEASAGSALLCVLAAVAIAVWMSGERLAARALDARIRIGVARGAGALDYALRAARVVGALVALAGAGSLAVLALWSLAGPWRFPDAWPSGFALSAFARDGERLVEAAIDSVLLATLSALAAVIAALACLEREALRARPAGALATAVLFAPLMIPQAAFVFGAQTGMIAIGFERSFAAVALAHFVYVFPYVFLALAGPYRAIDPRWTLQARALGAGPWRAWLEVKAPLALPAIAFAAALGFAVSFAQYLPTLAIGGGRIDTLATLSISLSSGGDRRLAAASAIVLAAAPLAAFALAARFGAGRLGANWSSGFAPRRAAGSGR